MSKIGIISDIHGNYPALLAVVQELKNASCDKIICLGDLAGYYAQINECVELVQNENIFCLKGNHDSYILGEAECPRSRSVNDCIAYQKKVIKPEYLEWFKTLKPVCITDEYYAMHGGFDNPIDEYVKDFDFDKAKSLYPNHKIFLSGHSHIQSVQQKDGILYCNPGSVGQPRDWEPKAAYAILENESITIHRVQYDIDQTAKAMAEAGFNDYYYRNLYKGCKIGEA